MAGRIDCISKCHSCLLDAFISSSKTADLVIFASKKRYTVHDIPTVHCGHAAPVAVPYHDVEGGTG